VSSGLSYKADANLANSDPTISGNATLKAAVSSGDDLLSGNTVLIGSFNLTDAQIQANAGNVPFLLSPTNFVQFGIGHISDSFPGTNGVFETVMNNNTATLGIVGKQIYMVVIAATNNSTLANSLSTAFQLGVFYQDMLGSSEWKFPAEVPAPGFVHPELADLTVAQDGLVLSPFAHVVVGTFGPDKSNAVPSATDFVLSSVPEPGSCVLLSLASAGILLRRRRGI